MSESRYDTVRVEAPNGSIFNTSRARASREGYKVLDRPTHNPVTGLPEPGKRKTPLGTPSTGGKTTTKKES